MAVVLFMVAGLILGLLLISLAVGILLGRVIRFDDTPRRDEEK